MPKKSLPVTMYAYVWQVSRRHQIALIALIAAVFTLTLPRGKGVT